MWIFYIIWYQLSGSDEETYLNIFLNSGRVYSIVCKDKNFLKNVMQVMGVPLTDGYNGDLTSRQNGSAV